jgi:sugar phosphate isomerase/epimerase
MSITRREFARITLAGAPAVGALLRGGIAVAADAPGAVSRWAGVQVGLNVPYSFGAGNNMSAEEVLKRTLEVGAGSLELRAQPVEHFLGSPAVRAAAEAAKARAAGGPAPAATPPTPEQKAEVRKWRLAAPSSRIKELRGIYEKAGVVVDILKVDDIFTVSDEEVDYYFQMARDLGARAISTELPEKAGETKRLGGFADRHKLFMAYHHHAQAGAARYEEVFAEAKYNGANIDIGHWTATQNASPLPFIEQHADRIPHIHVKDRKLGTNGGANTPFGEGDTAIRPILQAIRDHTWTIRPIVEFEYKVPEGSDRVTEIRKSLAFCKDALLAKA